MCVYSVETQISKIDLAKDDRFEIVLIAKGAKVPVTQKKQF